MYKRKTKDIFILKCNGEEIDTANNRKKAEYLMKEYRIANAFPLEEWDEKNNEWKNIIMIEMI